MHPPRVKPFGTVVFAPLNQREIQYPVASNLWFQLKTFFSCHYNQVWKVGNDGDGSDVGGGGSDDDDDCGLRAIGACIRTRVRVMSPSPFGSAPTVLFSSPPTSSGRSALDADTQGSSRGSRGGASTVFPSRTLQRMCEEGGFAAAARVRGLAAALLAKFDCTESTRRRTASRLLLGKRRRSSVSSGGGGGGSHTPAAVEGEDFDLEAALGRLDAADGRHRPTLHGCVGGPTARRSSLYHEFFTPSGIGGDEHAVPLVPSLQTVVANAVAAFRSAAAAVAVGGGVGGARMGALPWGAAVGAVGVARVVLNGTDVVPGGGGGALLLGWFKQVGGEPGGGGGRLVAHDDTGEMEVMLEYEGQGTDAPGGAQVAPTSVQLNSLFVAKKWQVVCEGAKVRRGALNESEPHACIDERTHSGDPIRAVSQPIP